MNNTETKIEAPKLVLLTQLYPLINLQGNEHPGDKNDLWIAGYRGHIISLDYKTDISIGLRVNLKAFIIRPLNKLIYCLYKDTIDYLRTNYALASSVDEIASYFKQETTLEDNNNETKGQ